MVLDDSFGRPLLNLRIAVTKRCNLNCSFCHGEGEEKCATDFNLVEMKVDEIVHIVRIAVSLGISRIKLTGGEPLMRKDIAEIVEEISALHGLKDLSMTTNGTMLAFQARELYSKGLKRVNINLPTLDPQVYSILTGSPVTEALDGVEAAVKAGFSPVKLNMLMLKGINDSAVPEMIGFAKRAWVILQLIELEPINVTGAYYSFNHKSLDQYEAMLKEKASKVETRRRMQNRRIYHLPNVDVETVRPTESTEFCLHCTRLRLTSDGKLKPCLMRNDNLVDILAPLQKGASDQELRRLFEMANHRRQPYNKN
jgi:cyclic pyranopterin phosphate synthase